MRDLQVNRVVHGRTLVRNLLQFGLGTLLIATGVGKALDMAGFVEVIHTYRLGLTEGQAWAAGIAVTVLELCVGAWLYSGRDLRKAALAAAALNVAWCAMLTVALLRGLVLANCGCFGVFLARPLRWYSPLEDLVIVAACLLLAGLVPPPRNHSAPE